MYYLTIISKQIINKCKIKPCFFSSFFMSIKSLSIVFICLILLSGCFTNRNASILTKRYPKEELLKDYEIAEKILTSKHPSLYWYTSEDSMQLYFEKYKAAITDSLTEQEFVWKVLSPLINKIHCGHTSVSQSVAYTKQLNRLKKQSFPLLLKIWNDTMVVTGSLSKTNSTIPKGAVIRSINNIDAHTIVQQMLDKLPTDGYADVVNYIRISFNFPYYFNNTFGVSNNYNIDFNDSTGNTHHIIVPAFDPLKDTIKTKKGLSLVSTTSALSKRKRKLLGYRSLEIDSSGYFATMRINTFSKGKLRSFYRKSFRLLRKKNIQHLIVDIRLNGGGRVYASTLLTKYFSDSKFKIADSIYANTNTLRPFIKYFKIGLFNEMQLRLISKRKNDNRFHQIRYETTTFSPKKRNHFNGNVYVLTSGPTFSASCLFANIVRHQNNITLLGEETGGGWYGNSGIMIPSFELPHTKVNIRMPLFRVVLSNHVSQKGTGILPEVFVGPTYDAVIKGYDRKWNAAKSLILKDIGK